MPATAILFSFSCGHRDSFEPLKGETGLELIAIRERMADFLCPDCSRLNRQIDRTLARAQGIAYQRGCLQVIFRKEMVP